MTAKNEKTMVRSRAEIDQETMVGIGRGLVAIDEAVRLNGYPGVPGSGLFMLLENAAAQLGISRRGFPIEAAEVVPAAEAEDDPAPPQRSRR